VVLRAMGKGDTTGRGAERTLSAGVLAGEGAAEVAARAAGSTGSSAASIPEGAVAYRRALLLSAAELGSARAVVVGCLALDDEAEVVTPATATRAPAFRLAVGAGMVVASSLPLPGPDVPAMMMGVEAVSGGSTLVLELSTRAEPLDVALIRAAVNVGAAARDPAAADAASLGARALGVIGGSAGGGTKGRRPEALGRASGGRVAASACGRVAEGSIASTARITDGRRGRWMTGAGRVIAIGGLATRCRTGSGRAGVV
jgi:hypothetical protein